MKGYLRLIALIYVVELILCIITPIAYPKIYYLPAFVLHGVILLIFAYGYSPSTKRFTYREHLPTQTYPHKELSVSSLWIFIAISLIFIPLYIRFYTGSGLLQTFLSFFQQKSGLESSYSLYQGYFSDNGLGNFTLSKLPYILGYSIFKISYITILLYHSIQRLNIRRYSIQLFILSFLFVSVGIARGTSLEMFEFICILTFSFFLRQKKKFKLRRKELRVILTVLAGGFAYFQFNKSLRFEGGNITSRHNQTFYFDNNSFVVEYLPFLAYILQSLSGYFVFGFYYISHCFNEIWLSSTTGFFALFTPNGLNALGLGQSTKTLLCGTVIDCGAMWIPDSVRWIESFGLILFLMCIYAMGRIAKRSNEKVLQSHDTLSATILYLIMMQMASFQVGSFLTSSSSSTLLVFFAVLMYFSPRLYNAYLNLFISNEKNTRF